MLKKKQYFQAPHAWHFLFSENITGVYKSWSRGSAASVDRHRAPPRQSGGEAGAQHGRSPAPQHQQQLVNGVAAVAALGMAAAAAEGDDAGDQSKRKQ